MAQDDGDKSPLIDMVAVPVTPPPQAPAPLETATVRSPRQIEARRITSTTPPRSSQAPHPFNASTPTTTRRNATKDLPSVDHIERAGVDDLRRIAKSLVTDLTDARITAANARLSHHLLLLETSQAAERAEVENALSRRQVDHLRVKQNRPDGKHPSYTPAAVQPPPSNAEILSQTVQDLESHCEALEELCDKLKREKGLQAERIQSLSEHNSLLINRIRENREHFTRIRGRSPTFPTPREAYTTPRRRYSRYQDDTPAHGPFAALIAADQILSQETASVPSTPTRTPARRFKHGHARNAHSLTSIQTPQSRDRPTTSDGFLGSQLLLSAPGSQLVQESSERERRHDRDSTISISDHDTNVLDDGLTVSQASSLAADMLRKNPSTYESLRASQEAKESSNLLQSKIFGNAKKPVSDHSSTKLKRQYGFNDSQAKSKKVRTDSKIGLGIET